VGIGSDTSFEAMTLGLIGMRERASAVGGQLEVRPGKRAGTIVTLSVPVKKAPKASTHDRRPIAS
jgi:signal transduction histidine kinase